MALRAVPVLVLSSLVLASLAPAQDPPAETPPAQDPVVGAPAAELLAQGRAALDEGDLPLAEEHFRAAIAGGSVEGWAGIAELCRLEGDLEGAADALWALHGARPQDEARKRELAALLCQLPGHEWEAYPLTAELVQEHPRDPGLRLQFARLQSILGWHEEARANYALAARASTDPKIAREAELGLADDYNRAGQRHLADSIYRQHLGAEADLRALRGLADLELRQGRPQAARALYQQVLDRDPDDFVAREHIKLAEAASRPRLFAYGQSYSDNHDWSRTKLLAGVEFGLGGHSRLQLGFEQADFEDAAGRELDRSSLLLGGDWRPNPFVAVHADLQAGDQGPGSPVRGGVGVRYEPTDDAQFAIGYRHDHFLDPADPFAFDRRNDATDTRLASRLGLQSETFHLRASYQPLGGLGFAGELEGGTIQDRNNRSRMGMQLEYGLPLTAGWKLTPRSFYARKHYQSVSALYFSPSNLESWGIGLELAAWSYDHQRRVFLDLARFYQPSGVDDWGLSADAGWEQKLGDASSLVLQASWLSTPERAPAPQLRSLAVMAGLALAF